MKIAVDFGHGLYPDTGAVGITKEENIIDPVGIRLVGKLREKGIEVIETRPSKASSVQDSLDQRANIANKNNVDLFISIHANSGGGKGTEVYTDKEAKLEEGSRFLQKMKSIGFINRGIKDGSDLAVIKNTVAKALLYEICFVDSKSDVDLFNSNIENIANFLYYAITGIEYVPNGKPDENFQISLYCHFENVGDAQNTSINNVILMVNEVLQIEAFALYIDKADVNYFVHLQEEGDIRGRLSGDILGSRMRKRRLEGIGINTTSIIPGYVIKYRVFIKGYGWTDFFKNGEFAGSRGKGIPITGINVKVEKS